MKWSVVSVVVLHLAHAIGGSSGMKMGRPPVTDVGSDAFSCNDEQGFLPAKNHCNKYYVCDPWVKLGVLKTCPRDTLFDPLDRKCTKNTEVTCSMDYTCYSRRNQADEVSNKTFISCKSRSHPRRIRCQPEGTVYDVNLDMCIWPEYFVETEQITFSTEVAAEEQTTTVLTTVSDTPKTTTEMSSTTFQSLAASSDPKTSMNTTNFCDPELGNLVLTVLLLISVGLLVFMIVTMLCLLHAYRKYLKFQEENNSQTLPAANNLVEGGSSHATLDRPIVLHDFNPFQCNYQQRQVMYGQNPQYYTQNM